MNLIVIVLRFRAATVRGRFGCLRSSGMSGGGRREIPDARAVTWPQCLAGNSRKGPSRLEPSSLPSIQDGAGVPRIGTTVLTARSSRPPDGLAS